MKKIISFAILGAFLLAAPVILLAQDVDITGTWVGETYVPDATEPDQLTLVFAKKDGKWGGTFSDTQGYASEAECEEIKSTAAP
ncbi:MAG: hypothetical protein WBB73_06135 [Candidatus Aminicenantaceae bacterium]